MKRIAITLIALTVLTSTAYAQAVQKTAREVDDASEVVDGRQVKHLQLTKQLNDAGIQNVTGPSATISNSSVEGSDFFTFEMISNGSGPITGQTGFDITIPTGVGAYSADWLRDVLESSNASPTIQQLPGGMQDAGGWYSIVAGGGDPNFESALGRWSRGGQYINADVDDSIYEIRFTEAGGKAEMRFTTGTVVDVPFELWYLANTPDDPSDDYRVPPRIFDDNANDVFDFKLDHVADEDDNDPASDWIYFLMPFWDLSPGTSGYDEWALDPSQSKFSDWDGSTDLLRRPLSRIVLMNWDRHQGETAPGAGDGPENAFPETGTTFRISASFPPSCNSLIDAGPPVSFDVSVTDGGIAAIDVMSTANASVDVSAFSPGDSQVNVKVTQTNTGDADFGAVLQLTDTNGNSGLCESGIEGLVIHNAGNIVLAIQPDSRLGTFASNYNFHPVNAFWPRDGAAVNHLFTGAPWVGAVVDGNKRVLSNGYFSTDWTRTPGSAITNAPGFSDQDIGVTYDDQSAGSGPIGLQVHQESFQWSDPTRDDFILFKYTLENTGQSGDLTDVFAALWLDPDIGFFIDQAAFDADRGLVYQFVDPSEGSSYVGLKAVDGSHHIANAYFQGPCNGTEEERYDCLTIGQPLDPGPTDLRIMVTSQPFDLAVGETHTVTMGLVMGPDLAELQANSDMMDEVASEAFVPTSQEGSEDGIPASYQLLANYPNPFNPTTTISFDLPEAGYVEMGVFDVMGHQVGTLVQDARPAGRHTVAWQAGDLPSGVYFYRMTAGDFVQVNQMLLIK